MEALQMYVSEFKELFSKPRQFLMQALNLCCMLTCVWMVWQALQQFTASESPVVVVLSGSMEPAFFRGDILFLNHWKEQFNAADIPVFTVEGRGIPIVHRMVNTHYTADGKASILTKGDNNSVDDRGLYARRQNFLKKEEVMGRAVGWLPYVGMVTIWLNDYPWLKYLMLGSMSFFVLIGRENGSWL